MDIADRKRRHEALVKRIEEEQLKRQHEAMEAAHEDQQRLESARKGGCLCVIMSGKLSLCEG